MGNVHQHRKEEDIAFQQKAAYLSEKATRADKKDTRLIFAITTLTIVFAVVQLFLIFYSFLETHATSVLSKFADSFVDLSTATINFFSVRYVARPPDKKHRFGHEKMEPLAVLVQLIFIFVLSFYLLYRAIESFIVPVPLSNVETGMTLLFINFLGTLFIVIAQRYVARKTNSLLIKADSIHYLTDLLLIVAVIGALWFSQKVPFVDGITALLIALYVLKEAWDILKPTIAQLLDAELDEEEREKIVRVIKESLPKVEALGYHWLRTRRAGSKVFIEFHLIFPPQMPLIKVHDMCDRMTVYLSSQYERAEILLHSDPAGIEEYIPDYELAELDSFPIRPIDNKKEI